MTNPLVRPLFDGPLDIVGDVHGELQALKDLLRHLGYDEAGSHPEGRRLVFLGDLTDRGPDSPGVVALVQSLVETGKAQCVLGNHDLNILLGDPKHDNHWFFGEEWSLDGSDYITPAVLADDAIRLTILAFFRTLPLALERDDLRVVHACWDEKSIETVRQATDAVELHNECARQIQAEFAERPDIDKKVVDREIQNRNPVKMLTSGPERIALKPFDAAGKTRHHERDPWWYDYPLRSDTFCVFGHYSRYRTEPRDSATAFCADYAVAKRWQERLQPGFSGGFDGLLAAVRFPEKVVQFDNGDTEPVSAQ